jgi:hypothetical protein
MLQKEIVIHSETIKTEEKNECMYRSKRDIKRISIDAAILFPPMRKCVENGTNKEKPKSIHPHHITHPTTK